MESTVQGRSLRLVASLLRAAGFPGAAAASPALHEEVFNFPTLTMSRVTL